MREYLALFLLLPALLLSGCAGRAPAEPSPPETEAPAARALTQEEVDQVNAAYASYVEEDNVVWSTEVNGFFTSRYADVRELDFVEFLRYFPGDAVLEAADQEEFAALAALPGGDGTLLKAQGADGQWYLIDWHGKRLLPDGYPYAISLLIAPDGSALLVESEDGKTAYIVTR